MATTKIESSKPRRRWFWRVLGAVAVLFVLTYFVVSSSAFFKRFVLPRVGRSINADLTVADAEISPFSQVVLHGLELKPKGAEPLFAAAEVRARYSLWAILAGTVAVNEVVVVSPVLTLVKNADGTSNLDPLLKASKPEKPAPSAAAAGKPSKPLAIDIQSVTVSNGVIRQVKRDSDGSSQTVELSGVDVRVANLKNGQTARADWSADIAFTSRPPAPATNAAVQAQMTGHLALALNPDLRPQAIQGDARCSVTDATGAFRDLGALTATINCDVTSAEVKQIALEFRKTDVALGQFRVSGPFDLDRQEGQLAVEIRNIDRNVLNLAGGARGIDFGSSILNSTNQVVIAARGKSVSVTGQITGTSLTVSQKGLTTPPLDVAVAYDLSIDQPGQTATIRTFTVEATRNRHPLLQGALTKLTRLAWAEGANAAEESAFHLTLSDLNLADWRAFLGTNVTSGLLSAKLDVVAQESGRQLQFTGTAEGHEVSAAVGGRRIEQAGFHLQCRGSLAQFRKLELASLNAKLSQRNQPVASAGITGSMDLKTMDGESAVQLEAVLPALVAVAGMPGLDVSRGQLRAKLNVTSQKAARHLSFTGTAEARDLSGAYGSNRVDQADLDLQCRGSLAEFRRLEVASLGLKLSQRGQTVASVDGAGSMDLQTTDAAGDLKLDTALPSLVSLVGVAGLEASSGTLKFDGHVRQVSRTAAGAQSAGVERSVQGDLALAGFTGRYGRYQFDRLDAAMAGDVDVDAQQANIRKLNVTLRQAGQPAGGLELKGGYNLATKTANAAATLTNVNQNLLRTFLAPALGERQLASISIQGSVNGRYDPTGDSEVKGNWQVKNLVVKDPSGTIPPEPLDLKLELDAALHRSVAEIRESRLTLTPTSRGKNEIQVQGRVDFTRTDAITGHIKVSAESLDATRYYDLFAGKSGPASAPASTRSPASSAPAESGAEQEPAAVTLPLREFTVDAAIGRLCLREVEATGLQTSIKVDGGAVLVKPLRVALNGGPVNGSVSLNLGVPGYQYDVDVNAKQVPLAPWVNSFQPDRRGRIGGTTTALVQLKGAGVTGASLQRHLAGQFDVTSTNLNLSIGDVRSPVMKSVINTIVGIPDLIRNPGAGVGNLLARLTGGGGQGQGSGFTDELTRAPINVIAASGNVGNGRVDLQRALVQSQAFQAEAGGVIRLAPVLTASTLEIPVVVSLRQPLAEKVGLAPAGTPSTAAYVRLPEFLKIKGTLADPKEDINYLALTAVAAKAGAGVLGKTGAGAAGILDTVGNLLGGGPAPGQGTNAPAVINPLDLFRRR